MFRATYLVLIAFSSAEIHSIQLFIYTLHIYVPKYFSEKTSIWPICPKQREHTGVIHFITVLRSGQLQEVVGLWKDRQTQAEVAIPQAGLMLVMHLLYGNYNLATQNSGLAAFSSGLAASVSLYNLYVQMKMNSNCRILHPFDRRCCHLTHHCCSY